MVNHDKTLKKILIEDEEVLGKYEMSKAYLHENPLRSGLNIVIILSFVFHLLALVLFNMLPAATPQQKISAYYFIGGVFYWVDLALVALSFTKGGNFIRRLSFGGFQFGFDEDRAKNADEGKDKYGDYLRNYYTPYILITVILCGINMQLLSVNSTVARTFSGLVSYYFLAISLFVIICTVGILVHMCIRRSYPRLVVVTNLRVISINLYDASYYYGLLDKNTFFRRSLYYYDIHVSQRIPSEIPRDTAEYTEYVNRMYASGERVHFTLRGCRDFDKLYDQLNEVKEVNSK